MIFTELTKEEYNHFVISEKTNNFFQSLLMYERYQDNQIESYLLGVKKNNKVIAATLISSRNKFLGSKIFEAIKGFVLDYQNEELVNFFTKEILQFIKIKKGFMLTIDPYIKSVSRDINGDIIDNDDNNIFVNGYLKKMGYVYIGEKTQVKWTFVLDINNQKSEELFKNFKQNTRNLINRTINKYELQIRELSYDELSVFKKITSETCDRKDFSDRSLTYYQDMYKHFKDKIKVIIAELNCDQYLLNLKSDIESVKNKLKNATSSYANELNNQLLGLEKKEQNIKELKLKKGNIIPISTAMFMLYGNEVVYLFSGSYKEYMDFYGQYRIQWEMIKYAADNKYQRYNFYGIKDFKDKNDPSYGIYEFKKGFNGNVEELLGVYEIGLGFKYKIYSFLHKIKK